MGFYWDENLKPDPKVIAKRLEAKAKDDSKRKLNKESIQKPLDVKKPPSSAPLPLETKSTVVPTTSLVRTISVEDFYKQMQGKIESGDEF